MELFFGAFTSEWESQRAALVHERERLADAAKAAEEELRRRRRGAGGTSRRGASAGRSGLTLAPRFDRPGPSTDIQRPLATRLEAIARGGQPAVVKMASYGGGARLSAMSNYISRGGELAIENERGERLGSADDLDRMHDEWSPLFQKRSDSRDIAGFHVEIEASDFGSEHELHALVRETLNRGFGNRRYAYAVTQPSYGRLSVDGIVMLRAKGGERLSGDHDAAEVVQARYDGSRAGQPRAQFSFRSYGNGVEYGVARLRSVVETHNGDVFDERGRHVDGAKAAGNLIQREWRRDLHSRKGRDVMHLIMSAREGTDQGAFRSASRAFLSEQFQGHKYVFSLHDPDHDPKEQADGGQRPHVHVHALILMRNHAGDRLITSPAVFKQWRELLAEKAREQGIAMEMTDRRELASAPAYSRNQVRVVNSVGRTEHAGTTPAAQDRYNAKRRETAHIALTDRSLDYAEKAKSAWSQLEAGDDPILVQYAANVLQKLNFALVKTEAGIERGIERGDFASRYHANMVRLHSLINEGSKMPNMTFDDFSSYEKGVETAIHKLGLSMGKDDKEDFEEIAKAARNHVAAQRQVIEAQENLEKAQAAERPLRIERDQQSPVAHPASPIAQVVNALEEGVKDTIAGVEDGVKKRVAQVVEGAAKTVGQGFPSEIASQYFTQERAGTTRVYADAKATREVFQDAGEVLRAKTFDPTAVRLMVDTAAHRGWTSIDIKGSKEFRRETWLEGHSRGIAVKGYQPTELDWQEASRREQAYLRNEIRQGEEKEAAKPAQEKVEQVAPAKSAKATASEQPSARASYRDGIEGTFVEQGSKPYRDDPKNDPSPYVVIRTEKGEQTVWGVGLPDAIYRANAKEGDRVSLKEDGVEQVLKPIIREVDGQQVRQEELVNRRRWEVDVVEEKEKQPAEVASSSVAQSGVKENETTSDRDPAAGSRLEELQRAHQEKQTRDELER